jgi:hypothetical protein
MKRIWISLAGAAAIIAALFGGQNVLRSQNNGQVLTTLLGSELVSVISSVNNTASFAYTTTANLRDGRDYVYATPLTGNTITMTVGQSALIVNPAGSLSTLNVVLPPTTFDGKFASVFTTQAISTLNLSTSNSATFTPTSVTTLAQNATVTYIYNLAGNVWYRMQ